MKLFNRALLPALITAALASAPVYAQDAQNCEEMEGTPPGLYATTDEGRTFLIKGDEIVELGPGEAGYANEDELKCIKLSPKFLDWPCATDAAQSRMFNTYTFSDLESSNKMKEIVQRYFDVPEVLIPIPDWVDGEYSGIFPYNDILQFSSPEYWYQTDTTNPVLSEKRPRSLLISLYVGTNQVVIDNNVIDALRADLGTNQIPVTFLFNDSNSVPVSFFGDNGSLEEVLKAFLERTIKVAEVPMWWLGDYHLKPTIDEYEKYFDIPALDDIPAEKQATLRADLEAYGFSRKPFLVTMMAGSGSMVVDQPERVRVAASMGLGLQTAIFFIEEDVHLARCGPGTPVGSASVSGATTPVGGPTVPPDAAPPPVPEPEEPASPS